MSQTDLDSVIAAGPPSKSESSPPLTVLACAIAIIITVGITVESSGPWFEVARGGYQPAERIWDGAVWALISSAFVHFAPLHLIFNVYWLWRLGGAVERTLGPFQFLIFIVAAAFLSSALQLAVSGGTGMGASGIVYGLFGLMWRSKEKTPRFAEILGADTASFFFIWLIACMIATRLGFVSIANTAHVAGLVFGVLVAEWRIHGSHRRMAAAAIVVLSVFSLLTTRSNPWSVRWLQHHAMKMHRARQYEVAALTYERSLSFGADSAWAFHNLALTYFEMRDTTRYGAALRSLRVAAPAEADSLELRLRGATR